MKLYNLYFSENRSLARRLRDIIGFTPSNLYLYEMAFHHKSSNENNGKFQFNNERLEYLGDAVLSMVVGDYLFKKYPYKDEGFLTKMRSKIVKRKTLNDVSQKMGLDKILSEYAIGNISNSMAGNALEALVGAIYQDVGYEKSRKFIIKNILRNFIDMEDLENNDDNYKSQLLEWAQKMGKNVNFSMNEKDKMNGRDYFKITLFIDDKKICESEAYNKKTAEQKASFVAINQLKINGTAISE
ncbi:MAG: ribonuclease III [Saprospiraceae bacterium]|nr:ribonuclease III [Saprospiraceae bacterium]